MLIVHLVGFFTFNRNRRLVQFGNDFMIRNQGYRVTTKQNDRDVLTSQDEAKT